MHLTIKTCKRRIQFLHENTPTYATEKVKNTFTWGFIYHYVNKKVVRGSESLNELFETIHQE